MFLRSAASAALLLITACTGANQLTSRDAAMSPPSFPGAASIPGATIDIPG